MVDKKSQENVSENLDITDELIAERRTSTKMPEDMTPWMAKTIEFIDSKMLITGKIFCWLTIFLIYAMIHEVIGRHFFNRPTLWSFDISRMLAGALFMLGAAYALSKGIHIRADFLYRNFKAKTQGIVDFWLYIFFYFPGHIFFLYMTTIFVIESIQRGEKGMDTAWMPYMWPIKLCLWIGIVLLLIQGISELLKSHYAMKKGKWPGE